MRSSPSSRIGKVLVLFMVALFVLVISAGCNLFDSDTDEEGDSGTSIEEAPKKLLKGLFGD